MSIREWQLSFRSNKGKYLTAESFGHQLSLNGSNVKSRQVFILEQDADEKFVFLRSYFGRYVTATGDFKFHASAEEKNKDQRLEIEVQPDGRWCFKGAHGRYCGGFGADMKAFDLEISEKTTFTPVLAAHPQVTFMNSNRKRFAHLSGDAITTDEDVPWGHDATLTLQFCDSGKYAIIASDGRALSRDGSLKKDIDASCEFIVEWHQNHLAFRNVEGGSMYLTAVNKDGQLKAAKPGKAPGKDELWYLEDSHPQFTLNAPNGRFASAKADEVSANQDKTTDAEYFQAELQPSGKFFLKTFKATYCGISGTGVITCSSKSGVEFEIEWLGERIAIKAPNGKYCAIKGNGTLVATSDEANDQSTFIFELINRPKIVLRGAHGYVNANSKGQLTCNNPTPELFSMTCNKGKYSFSTASGGCWSSSGGAMSADGSSAEECTLEFVAPSQMLIKTNGAYLSGLQTGEILPKGHKAEAATLWEF